MEHFKREGWRLVIVTNQSGIGRGFFNWADYENVTTRMLELLGKNASPTAIYANSHGPDAPTSSWRKPSPGMIKAATKELNLDPEKSILIGDRLSDLKAGKSAEVKRLVHVKTGHGEEERSQVMDWQQRNISGNKKHWGKHKLLLLDSIKDLPKDLAGVGK